MIEINQCIIIERDKTPKRTCEPGATVSNPNVKWGDCTSVYSVYNTVRPLTSTD